jgi:hypothetical protein
MKYISIILMSLFLVSNVNSQATVEDLNKFLDDSDNVYIYRYVEIEIIKSEKRPIASYGTTFNTLDECIKHMKEDVVSINEDKKIAVIKLDNENNMYMEATGTKGKLYTSCRKERVLCYRCMK